MKSKIHRVRVTESNLNYVGSITIDEDLMDAAGLIEGEKVQIVNNNNGERIEATASWTSRRLRPSSLRLCSQTSALTDYYNTENQLYKSI